MRLERDTRIDVIRAMALITIFITHVPGNFLDQFTLKNMGFADAAEVFVLVSGVAIGLVYAKKFQGPQQLTSAIALWTRVWVLVRAHMMTTIATLTLFGVAAILSGRPEILEVNNIKPLIDDPARVMVGIGTLGHQLGYNNILPMYAVLLLATPAILWSINRSVRGTLIVSAALWLIAGIWQIAPPNYPLPGFWFLNPLSWQFLYIIGMASMFHVRRGGRLPENPLLLKAAFAYLIGAFIWIHSPAWGQHTWFGLPPVLGGFDKTFLSVSRLLHVLSLAYLVVSIPALSNLARTAPDHPLAILGKHSLAVFVSGTVCAMAAQAIRAVYTPSLILDLALLSIGITIQLVAAYYLEWKDRARGAGMRKESIKVHVNVPERKPTLAIVGASSSDLPRRTTSA